MTLPALPSSGRVARRLDLFVCLLAFSVVAVAWTAVRYDLGFVSGASFVVPVALAMAALSLPPGVRVRRGIAALTGASLAVLACSLALTSPEGFLLERGLYASGSVLPSSPVESGDSHDFVVDIAEVERRTPDYIRTLVRVVSVDGLSAPTGLAAVAFFDSRARVSMGDRVSLRTRWRVPSGYDSPSYRRYLLGRGVYGSLSVREYRAMGRGASSLATVFEPMRERVRTLAHDLYPPDTAVVALGMLSGDRADMPDELRTRFTRSGLSHLLVVSGFNVAILALALSALLAWLPALPRAVAVCLGIAAFALFVGLDPPVARAALAGICSYAVVSWGRSWSPLALLSVVALATLCLSPESLALDPSFQLSYLAVAGLVLLYPAFERIFSRVPTALGARESLALTFAALVATLPVTVLSFGQVSLVAPLANLLAAPAAAVATVLGAVSLAFAAVLPALAYPVGFAEDLVLRYILLVARLGEFSFASFELDVGVFSPLYAAYLTMLGILALYAGFSSSRSKNSGS